MLRVLDFLFAGDGVLDRALEALDNGHVCRLSCPAGRVVYQVAATVLKGVPPAVAAAAGIHDGCYTVVDGFCTCVDFHRRVTLGDGRQFVSVLSTLGHGAIKRLHTLSCNYLQTTGLG